MRLDCGSLHDTTPRLYIVVDGPQSKSPEFFGIFSGYQWEAQLKPKIQRAGFRMENVNIMELRSASMIPKNVTIVGMGERTLQHFTDKKSIDKWQLSPLKTHSGNKFIPTFDMIRVNAQYELGLFQEMAFLRAFKQCSSLGYDFPEERFHLNPSVEETLAILDHVSSQPIISVDVETGYGQINTVGFAWSESDAIAINVLPDRCGNKVYHEIWRRIGRILDGESRKVFQNFIYDTSYFSAYGIRTRNTYHDTMFAMKVLWPEFKSNLGNVGRIYTRRAYWKDDGKAIDEEGAKKDWGNVRDWHRHYLYNCRDTTGTFEAHLAQRQDLDARKLTSFYDGYVMRLAEPISEMCANGMPLDSERRENLRRETEEKIEALKKELHAQAGAELNHRSSKQLLEYFRSVGLKIPKKFNRETGVYHESTDASSLKKIRLKNPEVKSLGTLAELKSLDTFLSRYIDFATKPGEDKLRYSINGTGTETLRFSASKDPWDRGFNIQTIPREGGDVSIKQMFRAPEGSSFMEIDLRQAESRFVAYDSADKTLIDMLESNEDVHKHVGLEILKQLGKPATEYSKDWRQLGKKSGHGANYAMKASVFVETCFAEMDVVLTKTDAEKILQAYHNLFPGIHEWHANIRKELNLKRKLTAPSGWERYFYGRFGDDMFKEAYAWRPQTTIPWITNHLMFHLCEERRKGNVVMSLIFQGHDALYLIVPDASLGDVAKVSANHKVWHPEIILPGGRMQIPVEIKAGKVLSEMQEWKDI